MDTGDNEISHWGEIATEENDQNSAVDFDFERIFADLEDLSGSLLPLNSLQHETVSQTLDNHRSYECQNSLVLHTVELHNHIRQLQDFITDARNHLQNLSGDENSAVNLPPCPLLPEYLLVMSKPKFESALPFQLPDLENEFAQGIGRSVPEIDTITHDQLLRRTAATIIAHIGFEFCHESALQSLISVIKSYMRQMTVLMRHSFDRKLRTGSTGFTDTMERVFHEMGVGSPRNLHDFYQNRVVRYHEHLLQLYQRLQDDYSHILNQISNGSESAASVSNDPEISVTIEDDDDVESTDSALRRKSMDSRLSLYDTDILLEDNSVTNDGDDDDSSSPDTLLSPSPSRSSQAKRQGSQVYLKLTVEW